MLRALSDAPAWHGEPLATWLSETLGCPPRLARAALETVDVRIECAPSALGLLDETWLYRTSAAPVAGEGVLEWTTLQGGFALVRTLATDAVHREKVMRALHARLGERPALQLVRARPAAPKRKLARADWTLARKLAAAPWVELDTKAEKERARKIAEDRVLVLVVAPRAEAHHVLLRMRPSSTAAAERAFGAIPSLYERHLPTVGEATHADGFALEESVAGAREVLGVASADARRVEGRWRDEAAWSALIKDAERRAA